MNKEDTLVTLNAKEKLIQINTSSKKISKKLLTYEKFSDFLKLYEEDYLLSCKIPLNWIKILPPKKKFFSAEELQKRSERMRKYNLSKKSKNIIE